MRFSHPGLWFARQQKNKRQNCMSGLLKRCNIVEWPGRQIHQNTQGNMPHKEKMPRHIKQLSPRNSWSWNPIWVWATLEVGSPSRAVHMSECPEHVLHEPGSGPPNQAANRLLSPSLSVIGGAQRALTVISFQYKLNISFASWLWHIQKTSHVCFNKGTDKSNMLFL